MEEAVKALAGSNFMEETDIVKYKKGILENCVDEKGPIAADTTVRSLAYCQKSISDAAAAIDFLT